MPQRASSQHSGLRLLKQIALCLVVWYATLTFVNLQLTEREHGPLARGVLAGLGIAGFLPWLFVSARSILAQDEFSQRRHLVALACAFAGTGLLSLSVDFLQKAGFVGDVPFSAAWPAMVVLWIISLVATSRYYR